MISMYYITETCNSTSGRRLYTCENVSAVVKFPFFFWFPGSCQRGKIYQGDCSDASSQEEGERKIPLFAQSHACLSFPLYSRGR